MSVQSKVVLIMLTATIILQITQSAITDSDNSTHTLSRKKRYLIFPKGSSVQLVYCYTFFIEQSAIFKLGVTAGLAWRLPDDPDLFKNKKKHQIFRREVYSKIESYMNAHDINGRDCILRALCESGQRTSSKKNFLLEILHKIFSLTEAIGIEDEPYVKAHRSVNSQCSTLYPSCPFSLFNQDPIIK